MPKVTTITLGETKIELNNTIFGKETIIVNDREVSSKKSISGTVHNFTVKESGEVAQYEFKTGLNLNGIAVSLYRNGKPVIESPSRGKLGLWTVFVTGVLVVLGYLLGKGIL